MNRIVYPMVTREKSYLGSIWNCIAGVINRYFRDIQAILPFQFLWVYFYGECCLFNNIYMKRCRIIYIIWHLNVAQNLPLQKLFLIKANYTLLALTEKPFKNRRYNNRKSNISFYICTQLSYILLYPKFNNIKKYLAYMNLLVWTTPLPKLFHSSIFPALTPISGPDSIWTITPRPFTALTNHYHDLSFIWNVPFRPLTALIPPYLDPLSTSTPSISGPLLHLNLSYPHSLTAWPLCILTPSSILTTLPQPLHIQPPSLFEPSYLNPLLPWSLPVLTPPWSLPLPLS